jgi:methionine sulfoxide reductase heme-binding subunit
MSLSYQAVGWNRQKKRYDLIMAGGCLLFLAGFCGVSIIVHSEITFETLLIRSTSTLAFLLLHVILSIGPLARLDSRFLPLLYNRRHMGVTMFVVAATHGIFSIIQFHSLGNVPAIVSLFTSNTRFYSIAEFPFHMLGAAALLIFLIMAATSHDFWLKNLSPRTWKTLHMLVYAAYLLVFLHVMLGVIQYETHPAFVILNFVGAGWLTTIHLAAGNKEVKEDRKRHKLVREGFYKVCRIDEIQEDRAITVCIREERIAIFKTGGKLFAISNVCKHQNGPLGEGKIIDGCITCPWHGYQYLPHNGRSPAPFKEKVCTYDVMLVREEVFVNPTPYPEGTERPGAVIAALNKESINS